MRWHVIIPKKDAAGPGATVSVEADNWYSALEEGLSASGVEGRLLSNLTCNINPDGSLTVTDFVTDRVFTLEMLDEDGQPVTGSNMGQDAREFDPTAESEVPGAPPQPEDEPEPHKIFFWRDGAPDDGSGIFYRERLLAVRRGLPKETASRLVHAYFDQLKALGADEGTKLFITVQVFDHEFREHSVKPAVAALTWREWSPGKPRIIFPYSGDEGITFSKIPPAPADDQPKDAQPELAAVPAKPPVEQPLELTPDLMKRKPGPRRRPARRTPALTPPPRDSGVDEKMIDAFERMQEIYEVRDHDKAGGFALDLARDLIECEAGSAMLITPGKYELYVAAARGPVSDEIEGKKISFRKGIVAFATRMSTVINVRDAEHDKRFEDGVDAVTGFKTTSVLCAPIQFEGRTIGALELLNSPREGGFTQGEANILSYVGSSVAEYINTSLPSREADFSDREFLEPLPRSGTAAKKKKKATGAPAKKKTTKKPATGTKKPATGAKKPSEPKKASAPAEKKPAEKKSAPTESKPAAAQKAAPAQKDSPKTTSDDKQKSDTANPPSKKSRKKRSKSKKRKKKR